MIYTLTLNPALDKTMYYDKLNIGKVNICNEVSFEAGGKGINTAKVLHALGCDVTSVAVLGGSTGEKIEQMLNSINLKQKNIRTDKQTRINTKIIDRYTSACTELNEIAEELQLLDIEKIDNMVNDILGDSKYITLSGSLPRGVDSGIYAKYISLAKEKGIRTILDTSGDGLKKAIPEKPWFIKPNIDELSEYFNENLLDEKNIIEKCKLLNDLGVVLVVVTLGEEGLICTCNDKAYVIKGFEVDVISTVGAGDSFIGGFVFKYNESECIESSLKFGMATALVKITSKAGETITTTEIDKYYNELNVEIYNIAK